MNDQESPAQANEISAPTKPARFAGAIQYFKGYLEKRRAKKAKQNPVDRAATSTARATWAIAVLTAVTIGVGWSQYRIFDRQLSVMQGQLDAMEADQRPWIKVEKIEPWSTTIGGGKLGGLEFAKHDFIGFLPLHVELKNVGHSPAFNIQVGVWPFYGYAQKDLNLLEAQQTSCERMSRNLLPMPMATDGANYIRVLFPDSQASYDSAALGLQPEDIKKFSIGDDPTKKTFQLWFYGCVVYNFNGSQKAHQTGFAYRVGHKVQAIGRPQGEIAEDITFTPWESIPADLLMFEPRPTAAGDTN